MTTYNVYYIKNAKVVKMFAKPFNNSIEAYEAIVGYLIFHNKNVKNNLKTIP